MDADDVHREWSERTGAYSPRYYADYGPTETSTWIRAVADHFLDPDDPILELGCSAGRHLAVLHDHGYRNLHGVDINDDALDTMADAYPDLAADGTFHVDAIERAVPEFDDRRFALVYSVETLQHIPPENDHALEDVARVTDDALVTVENEGEIDQQESNVDVDYVDDDFPLYHRNWRDVFAEFGFTELDSKPDGVDTFRLFHRA